MHSIEAGLISALVCSSKPESTAAPHAGEQITATGPITHEAVQMQSDDTAHPAGALFATGASLNSLLPQQSQQHQGQPLTHSAAPVQGQQQTSAYPGACHVESALQPAVQT